VTCGGPQVDDSDEHWERDIEVDDGEARWVGATRIRAQELLGGGRSPAGWNVTVAVMEFVREEPLEGELRRRIATTLRSVEGVESAGEMDREVWWLNELISSERESGAASPPHSARRPSNSLVRSWLAGPGRKSR
jgi:hypothetical protein